MAGTKYRYVGDHAWEAQVGDKTLQVEPGGFVTFSKDDLENPYNKTVIDAGKLIEADGKG